MFKFPKLEDLKVPMSFLLWSFPLVVGGWSWVDSTFVYAADFKRYQVTVDRRLLERDRRQLESDILRLDVKRQVYPQAFDAMDKAMLDKMQRDLQDVRESLRELEREERRK